MIRSAFKKSFIFLFVSFVFLSSCSIGSMAAESTVKEYPLNICYCEENGRIYNKDGKGFLFGFDYDKDDNFWYTPIYPWQRNFGYSKVYDDLAFVIGCYFDTVRVYFEYDGMEWLIQYWKGIYGFTSGAEIGVYYRPIGVKGSFYQCVSEEDMPLMSLTVKNGDAIFFVQPEQTHWWLTGFVLPSRYSADELCCEMAVNYGDKVFASLLVNGLEENGFVLNESIIVKGTRVTLIW